MERSLEKFITNRNIARYTEQLKIESDPLKRKILLDLMAKQKEEAKRTNQIRSKEK